MTDATPRSGSPEALGGAVAGRDDGAIVSFTQPPVVEVVCGVQFGLLPLATAHFGRFWDAVSDAYPHTRDLPPLATLIEAPPGQVGSASVQWSNLPELRRVFFLNLEKGRLLQLQADRFHANWQKLPDGDAYPRFPEVFGEFHRRWKEFVDFVHKEGLPEPQVVQAELLYINAIPLTDAGLPFPRIIPWLQPPPVAFAAPPEAEASLHFEVGEIRGRLHVAARTVRLAEGLRVLVLELTARGAVGDDGLEAWFAAARRTVVESFAEFTSEEAQRAWGRTR